jgi:hypothetical protein
MIKEVLYCNIRNLGTPVYGPGFFRNNLSAFSDSTRIISIKLDGETITSGILARFDETLEISWSLPPEITARGARTSPIAESASRRNNFPWAVH